MGLNQSNMLLSAVVVDLQDLCQYPIVLHTSGMLRSMVAVVSMVR